jgi:hypothetical protein
MKTTFYIILLLITVSSCTKENQVENNAIEEPIFENVIYLDFNGETVKDNSWNNGNEMYLQSSGLSGSDQRKIIEKVKGYFSLFKVTVTDNINTYLGASSDHRQQIILTVSSDWYGDGKEPGTALIGSWGTETPCFVFPQMRYNNPEAISIVVAHEIGHCLNLDHQSEYDENCTKTNEYRKGSIMGIVDSVNADHWTIGQSSLDCGDIQDDIKQMASILSFK